MSTRTAARAYSAEIETDDGFTLNVLRKMTETHRRFVHRPKSVRTAEYVEYAVWVSRLAHALSCVPAAERVAKAELFWAHGDKAYNCIWYEVICASIKAAHAVVRDSVVFERTHPSLEQRKMITRTQVQPMIGVLNFVVSKAYALWVDCPGDLEDVFTRTACEDILHVVRAYGFWNQSCIIIADRLVSIEAGEPIATDDPADLGVVQMDEVEYVLGLDTIKFRNKRADDDASAGPEFAADALDEALGDAAEFAYGAYMWLAELPTPVEVMSTLSPTDHDTDGLWNPSSTATDFTIAPMGSREAKAVYARFKKEDTWIANAKARYLTLVAYRLGSGQDMIPLGVRTLLWSTAERNGANLRAIVSECVSLMSSQTEDEMKQSAAAVITQSVRDTRGAYFAHGAGLIDSMPDVSQADRLRKTPPARAPECNLVVCTGSVTHDDDDDKHDAP